MEIGGWLWGGGQQGLGLDGEGFEFSDQEVTSGASYQQVAIANVSAKMMAVRAERSRPLKSHCHFWV